METPDFKAIAGQLRHPHGEAGQETAIRMAENNAGMIRSCIDLLPLKPGDRVLEIGPGGAAHLPYFVDKAKEVQYTGADISATMIQMAMEGNKALIDEGIAIFTQLIVQDGYAPLPFETGSFNSIFTVNTIYFWDNAPAQALEIFRVLRPGGVFLTAFATEAFMQGLPFTQYNFNLYTPEKARALLEGAGFIFENMKEERETVYSNTGPLMERDFIVMAVSKPLAQ
ncbi:class I SAM-dependent methyltransferase [Taibaiella koreensis]|uniref:class I SAM-dependent methyltransferase n=1 Tax=Taibaiella koreensis TaxID=1268548 RepID=UPI000E59B8AC|nr:class I SAM-dependent methyltransferase [Taibaiella koreensis]